VEASLVDVVFDTEDPVFHFGHGLRNEGGDHSVGYILPIQSLIQIGHAYNLFLPTPLTYVYDTIAKGALALTFAPNL